MNPTIALELSDINVKTCHLFVKRGIIAPIIDLERKLLGVSLKSAKLHSRAKVIRGQQRSIVFVHFCCASSISPCSEGCHTLQVIAVACHFSFYFVSKNCTDLTSSERGEQISNSQGVGKVVARINHEPNCR